eukprot:TRINITY_DN1027_c0_g1_i15.p1 TRINITY_DN1027_c0_g1~~TRINITY_DN1027_c0_g1_i15.p1  ORF type:complete len:181 (+),score=11.46 TRINITY_DN1027_c0_g1_i15:492-1034(+)
MWKTNTLNIVSVVGSTSVCRRHSPACSSCAHASHAPGTSVGVTHSLIALLPGEYGCCTAPSVCRGLLPRKRGAAWLALTRYGVDAQRARLGQAAQPERVDEERDAVAVVRDERRVLKALTDDTQQVAQVLRPEPQHEPQHQRGALPLLVGRTAMAPFRFLCFFFFSHSRRASAGEPPRTP